MERIVFIERKTIQANFRPPAFEHEWIDYAETLSSQVIDRIRDATIVISNKLSLGESELSEAKDLKLIAIAATGSDCVDLDYCRRRGIAVCNVRGYATNSVPEHVLMMILALRRSLFAYRRDVQRGLWSQSKQFCLLTHELHDIKDSTLAIIGYGSIGKAMARLARSIGMRVLISEHKDATEIRAGRTRFEDALSLSDIVSLHCPLNDETRDLIGLAELKTMKPYALLINTARGALIDDAALTLEAFGGVHLVCNNAGVFAGGLSWEAPVSDYQWVLGVNTWGVIHGIRTFVPILLSQGEPAHVVNTASMAALTSGPLSAAYFMSKHAVLALSESLYLELRQKQAPIGVSVVCPELIATRIGDADRNRPVHLKRGDTPASPERDLVEQAIRAATQSQGAPPDVIAERTLRAIREDRFYVLAPEGDPWRTACHARFDAIRSERNPGMPPS
jgi:glycerate dehydrogenase